MVTGSEEKSVFSRVDQIGIVVKDMEATMKFYEKMFRIEPFPTVESDINSAKLKIGFFQLGEVQIELIQVLQGETIHSRFLEKKGEGLHHFKEWAEDCQAAIKEYEKKGFKVIQSGRLGKDEFYYLDTFDAYGFYYEIGNNAEIRKPDRQWSL